MKCLSVSANLRVMPLGGESSTAYNNMGHELLAQFFHPSAVKNLILAGLRNQQKHRHDNRGTISPLGSKLYDISLRISELDPYQWLYNALRGEASFAPRTFWANRLHARNAVRELSARSVCCRRPLLMRLSGTT